MTEAIRYELKTQPPSCRQISVLSTRFPDMSSSTTRRQNVSIKMSYENMTNAEPVAWRPDKPHNQLPPIPPPQELESRAVLKADDGRAWRLLIDSRKGSGSNADHAWMQSSQFWNLTIGCVGRHRKVVVVVWQIQ